MRQEAKQWNYKVIVATYIITYFISILILPCLCQLGIVKIAITSIIFVVIGVRIILAWRRKEQSNGWKVYLSFILITPVILELYFEH